MTLRQAFVAVSTIASVSLCMWGAGVVLGVPAAIRRYPETRTRVLSGSSLILIGLGVTLLAAGRNEPDLASPLTFAGTLLTLVGSVLSWFALGNDNGESGDRSRPRGPR